MKYAFYVVRRYVLTFYCKLFADIAINTHWKWVVKVLDFFIKRRGLALGNEAVICMNKTKKWQKNAEKCVIAFHDFEKYVKDEAHKKAK